MAKIEVPCCRPESCVIDICVKKSVGTFGLEKSNENEILACPYKVPIPERADCANALCQPHLKPGKVDAKGVYQNSFQRPGRVLQTKVFIKKGALRNLPSLAQDIFPEGAISAEHFLVTDTIVDPLYSDTVLSGLQEAGFRVRKIIMPADTTDASGESTGEPHKTMEVLLRICDEILANGVSKHSCVISLGGGVVNNVCGMAASMVYRGITLLHIATTSMAMFDAAIDFKQAVNHHLGKNLLGAYYPARAVLIDPACLATLSERHVLSGLAEALKHGLAQSPSLVEQIVGPFRENGLATLRDAEYLERICKAMIEIKCPTLDYYHDSDYNEMVPQYGHAIGHALEHISWSSPEHEPLLHGEAVSIGMCVSAEVARALGICDSRCVDEHYEAVGACGLPACIPATIDASMVRAKIVFDKHFVEKPIMGLPARLGQLSPRCSTDGSASYAWAVEDEVLAVALGANIARRDVVCAHKF